MIYWRIDVGLVTNKWISDEIVNNNYKLFGQLEVSELDYLKLKDYLKLMVNKPNFPTATPDLMLSLALVQIAIREYKEGKYWSCLMDIVGTEIPYSKLNYFGQVFAATVKKYNMFARHREFNEPHMYVEYIKDHAFVTNYYMRGYFEFAFAFFENNLLRQLDQDLTEDLEALSEFMSRQLNSDNDTITSDDSSKHAAKTYKLLKSTRMVFAQCDPITLKKIFYPTLKLLDDYYYDEKMPESRTNRFSKGLMEWIENNTADKKNNSSIKIERSLKSKKPYLKVNLEHEYSTLIIPQQKFRDGEYDDEAVVEVTINGVTRKKELDIYKSFGVYITEELEIPVPSIFDAIIICIKTKIEKQYSIEKSSFRIFDNNWMPISKFEVGVNNILIDSSSTVSWSDGSDIIDSYNYGTWNFFSAHIDKDTVCYIDDAPVSIYGKFSIEPIFEEIIERFKISDINEREFIGTRTHPVISFIINKSTFNGTMIYANSNRYAIKSLDRISCVDWLDDNSKVAVTVDLEGMLPNEDGKYQILLDEPGESNVKIAEYIRLQHFNCTFNKPRYMYDTEAMVKIDSFGYKFTVDNKLMDLTSIDGDSFEYLIRLSSETPNMITITLELEETYLITMPIRVFRYGFSNVEMKIEKPDYIWYNDIRENLYINMPGATELYAYMNKNEVDIAEGVMLAEGIFRVDISKFVRAIREGEDSNIYYYINIVYYDNAKRHINLPTIMRKLSVKPYFTLIKKNGYVSTEVAISGDANLFVDVMTEDGNDVLIHHKKIENGINYFCNLDPNQCYDLQPYMEEKDEFGLFVNITKQKYLNDVWCIDPNDLSMCRISIKHIIEEDEILQTTYKFMIFLDKKIDENVYLGGMVGTEFIDGKPQKVCKLKFNKARFKIKIDETGLHITLRLFSYKDMEWSVPFYDKKRQILLAPDAPILRRTREYDRYIDLDTKTTVFYSTIDKVWRNKR